MVTNRMSAFLFTAEQIEIIKISKQMCCNEILKINAFAGTGKTSTLIAIAKENPTKRFLYLAFNNAIVEESRKKFPSNVIILTTHSLACRRIAIPYIERGFALHDGNYMPIEIADYYKVDNLTAYEALCVFEEFLTSDKRAINTKLSPAHELAKRIYMDMVEYRLLITHSFYLKQFQLLEDKELSLYDYVMLDEGQDTNDVTLDIFMNIDAAKIIVGDTHQAIYAWRGAENAMNKIEADYNCYLTTTFRCKPHIVERANFILKNFKGEKVSIQSGCTTEPCDDSFAVITRTNAKIIENIADFDDDYRLIKNPKTIFETAISLYFWSIGDFDRLINTSCEYLTKFKSKGALNQYIADTNSLELKSSLGIAQRYKKGLFYILKKAKTAYAKQYDASGKVTKEDNRIILLSGHTSKGLEFDRVEIESDFPSLQELYLKHDKKNLNAKQVNEETNLYYVAVTRAKYHLNDSSKNDELF